MRNKELVLGMVLGCLIGCNSTSQSGSSTTSQGVKTTTTTTTPSYTHFVYVGVSFFIEAFGVDPDTGNLVSIDNGQSASVNEEQVQNMLISTNGKWIYFISDMGVGNTNGFGQFSINSSTGLLTKIGTGFLATNYPSQFALDANGLYLYSTEGTSNISTYAINPSTGALSLSATQGIGSQAQIDAFAAAHSLTWTSNTAQKTSTTVSGNTYEINSPQNRVDLYQEGSLTSYSTYLYEASNLISK